MTRHLELSSGDGTVSSLAAAVAGVRHGRWPVEDPPLYPSLGRACGQGVLCDAAGSLCRAACRRLMPKKPLPNGS